VTGYDVKGQVQVAGLEPCLAEVFTTASLEGLYRADLCENAFFWSQETRFWLLKMDESDLAGTWRSRLSKDMLISAK
jgi:hypothetical protein